MYRDIYVISLVRVAHFSFLVSSSLILPLGDQENATILLIPHSSLAILVALFVFVFGSYERVQVHGQADHGAFRIIGAC